MSVGNRSSDNSSRVSQLKHQHSSNNDEDADDYSEWVDEVRSYFDGHSDDLDGIDVVDSVNKPYLVAKWNHDVLYSVLINRFVENHDGNWNISTATSDEYEVAIFFN